MSARPVPTAILVVLSCSAALALAACGGDDSANGNVDGGGVVDGADASEPIDAEPPVDAADPSLDGGSACGAPGVLETVACGSCGIRDRVCAASGDWVEGECRDEGACAPGSERSVPCGSCGAQSELCSDACEWEPAGACEGEGECTPGTRSRSAEGCTGGATREVECSATCTLEPIGTCEAETRCDTPGATEHVPCGSMCGTVERYCTSENEWLYGVCVEAGECVPGTIGSEPCGRCGTQPRRCTTACTWELAGACTGEGECSPGETMSTMVGCVDGGSQLLTCDATCTFQPGICILPPVELVDGLGGPVGYGEGTLALGDDLVSPPIELASAFPHGLTLYGASYTTLVVSNNGALTFGGSVSSYTGDPFPVTEHPLVAPWWGDVDTRSDGRPARNNVHWAIDGSRLVATWHLVGYFDRKTHRLNSFQVLLTDRSDVAPGDFDVEFRYARCEWTTGDLGGVAQAGFDSGNQIDFLALPGSGTTSMLDLCTTTNAGQQGLWRFEVRGGIPR